MSPWEKDQKDFIQDVGVGDVEVVFERGDGDVAIELQGGYINNVATKSRMAVLTFCSMYSCPAAIAVLPT